MTLLIELKNGRKFQVTELDEFVIQAGVLVGLKKNALDGGFKNIIGYNVSDVVTYKVDGEVKVFELGV